MSVPEWRCALGAGGKPMPYWWPGKAECFECDEGDKDRYGNWHPDCKHRREEECEAACKVPQVAASPAPSCRVSGDAVGEDGFCSRRSIKSAISLDAFVSGQEGVTNCVGFPSLVMPRLRWEN